MQAVLESSAIQAVFAQPASDGSFDADTRNYLASLGAKRKFLFLAFAPKAAGTFFRQAAMGAIGGELFRMSHAQGGRDGVPCLPNFLACYLGQDLPQIVVHIHMQAFPANRHLLSAFGIRPVIMLRNIPDMLASFWDMLEEDAVARAEGLNCIVPADFTGLSAAQKADFMVDMVAPWYASYFASWKNFVDEAPKEVCVLRYRHFRRDPAESLHAAITHAGFVVSRAVCTASLESVWAAKDNFRYNKGTEGRGKAYLSSRHIEEIARKLSYYPQLKPWMGELMAAPALSQISRAS